MVEQLVLERFVASDFVVYVDNGRAPRTLHDYGYEHKVGTVNHITVNGTLEGLTAYFNGGQSQGSSHFGIGRELAGEFQFGEIRIPVAQVHQYMPLRRNAAYPRGCSPWAQGVIERATAPAVQHMRPGEPNGAFHSIENVAWAGSDGLTDPQFNSNVLLRAYCASLDGYTIDSGTQLWHSEIDGVNRAHDPGWLGTIEDELQDAARRLLRNDLGALHGVQYPDTTPLPAPAWFDIREVDVGAIRLQLEAAAPRIRDRLAPDECLTPLRIAHAIAGGDSDLFRGH